MARMFPHLDEPELNRLNSRAEARFYAACRDQLGPDVLVVHSLALVRLGTDGAPHDEEADFVVFDPAHGILVVEVKGGGVEFDPTTGRWASVGRSGRHEIKDPFRQAVRQKHAIIDYVRRSGSARSNLPARINFAHAVMLPDIDSVERVRAPAAPVQIIGGRRELADVRRWMERVFVYWAGDRTDLEPLGRIGVAACEKIFCAPIQARPVLSSQLAEEESQRIELTRQQSRLLRAIGMRRRAAICGGAGTGKTLLALEKALELAATGKRTLLLCYNRPLSEYLKVAAAKSEGLQAMTFHQLCEWRVRAVRAEGGGDCLAEAKASYPAADLFDVQLPFALALAVERNSFRYDAIVVDEAQDFRADFWMPIEMLLAEEDSNLYAFLDHNQAIYGVAPTLPIEEDPFLLTVNCRNTRVIHDSAYRFYSGVETEGPSIAGAPIQELVAATFDAQVAKIGSVVVNLIAVEKVSPADIAVLVLKDRKQGIYDAVCSMTLPQGARWGVETHRDPGAVVLDTVARFKGLEAAVVILCGFETANLAADRELLYVGLSRAKSKVYLVGSPSALSIWNGPSVGSHRSDRPHT